MSNYSSATCWKEYSILPPNSLDIFDKNQFSILHVRLFLDPLFCSIDLCLILMICVSILTPITNCSLPWINFKFGNHVVQFVQIFSFLKTYLAILGSLHFHIGFRIISSISIRKSARILTGTVWNLWINFQRADT